MGWPSWRYEDVGLRKTSGSLGTGTFLASTTSLRRKKVFVDYPCRPKITMNWVTCNWEPPPQFSCHCSRSWRHFGFGTPSWGFELVALWIWKKMCIVARLWMLKEMIRMGTALRSNESEHSASWTLLTCAIFINLKVGGYLESGPPQQVYQLNNNRKRRERSRNQLIWMCRVVRAGKVCWVAIQCLQFIALKGK